MISNAYMARHQEVLQSAGQALLELPASLPATASALVEVGAAWADYLVAFDESLRSEAGSGELGALLERLGRASGCLLAEPPLPARLSVHKRQLSTRYGIPWLPGMVPVNDEPTTLYVWTERTVEEMLHFGFPTAELFLVGRLDPQSVVGWHGSLVRVDVPSGIAVEVEGIHGHLPAYLSEQLGEGHDAYLLPLGLLPHVRITEVYQLDGRGDVASTHEVGDGVLICFEHARHGVRHLPNDVVRWPNSRRRSEAKAFLHLPIDPRLLARQLAVSPGWLPVFRERPFQREGHYALSLKVKGQTAIDIMATAEWLADVTLARAELRRFAGLDLVLPQLEFASAEVCGVMVGGRQAAAHRLRGLSLAEAIDEIHVGSG